MATLTASNDWTATISTAGDYDVCFRADVFEDLSQNISERSKPAKVYLGRGTTAPTTTDDAIVLRDGEARRITIKSGDTAYIHSDGTDRVVYYYAVS